MSKRLSSTSKTILLTCLLCRPYAACDGHAQNDWALHLPLPSMSPAPFLGSHVCVTSYSTSHSIIWLTSPGLWPLFLDWIALFLFPPSAAWTYWTDPRRI
ncbi:hypothetical protein BD626DRAFT_576264 [Schizophyllum amplum]|uniref:Secreted protein n=1 Tax=Schizophyllum amplum TaxID=97359 RepID=A0A550BTV8_9AGAR|nr:hypothetical protein BD626DRAFT_576264 [Auriculariopsis ampla]